MATIGAENRRPALLRWAGTAAAVGLAAWLVLGSCTPVPGTPGPTPTPVAPAPETVGAQPDIRIGLAVGASTATIGGRGELLVHDPAGSLLARVAPAEIWRIAVTGTGLVVVSPAGGHSTPSSQLEIVPADSGAPVPVNGRPYRGTVSVLRDRTGITLVNRVPLEQYLQGVVSAEMGRRSPSEQEALRAQAVVSRTYAVRNQGRWASDGFDLYASIADQVYGGAAAETPEGMEAVGSTSGEILAYNGQPIDAFFYSTCGGRTADGTEIFRAADRPYLRSISDVDRDGMAYCSISPRFRWHEEWSGEVLRSTLRRTLPAAAGITAGEVREIRDVRVVGISASGRVSKLGVDIGGRFVQVDEPLIRQVLRPPSGDLLRSNTFTLRATGAGRRVIRLVADGSGAGHGVGFCQWGAVGRARVGQDYRQILASYYSGTTLERLY